LRLSHAPGYGCALLWAGLEYQRTGAPRHKKEQKKGEQDRRAEAAGATAPAPRWRHDAAACAQGEKGPGYSSSMLTVVDPQFFDQKTRSKVEKKRNVPFERCVFGTNFDLLEGRKLSAYFFFRLFPIACFGCHF